MKKRIARLGARVALIPFEILIYAAVILGLIFMGAVLVVMHVVIALRNRAAKFQPRASSSPVSLTQ